MNELDKAAMDCRNHIRKKAGLACDWNNASEEMKNWYRMLVRRT